MKVKHDKKESPKVNCGENSPPKVKYNKKSLLPHDSICLLKKRGLNIPNEKKALSYLTNIGYYRLSAYFHPLLKEPKSDHNFKPEATFDSVMNMYRFDRKLRILLFNEIEKIEVSFRSVVTNCISDATQDVFWMTNPKHFHNSDVFSETLALIDSEMEKTKESFISHFKNKYSDPYPPAWMIAEIVTLGILCTIYNNLKNKYLHKKIASSFNLSPSVFSSWIKILANLRNLCGHHVRLWNRENSLTPELLKCPGFSWIDNSATDMKRIYIRICIIKYLLFTVSPRNKFTKKLKDLLSQYPTIDIRAMGFPVNWQSEPLWM